MFGGKYWKIVKDDWPIITGLIVIAAIMWWIRALGTSRDASITLPIEYIGIDRQVWVNEDLPQSVTIDIHDSGKWIRLINRQQPTISIDLTPYFKNESGSFSVSNKVIRDHITNILPGTTSLQRYHPEHIDGTYYRLHSKTVPVVFTGNIVPKEQYQIDGKIAIQPDRLTIYGKKEVVEALQKVETEATQFRNIKGENTLSVKLTSKEGVIYPQESVEIHVNAEQYTEKKFVLPISVHHVPSNATIRLFPASAEVSVRVSVSRFAELKDDDLELYCDFPLSSVNNIPIEYKTYNKHISNIRINPTIVEYIIERNK